MLEHWIHQSWLHLLDLGKDEAIRGIPKAATALFAPPTAHARGTGVSKASAAVVGVPARDTVKKQLRLVRYAFSSSFKGGKDPRAG